MTDNYNVLSEFYDIFTKDVLYPKWIEYFLKIFELNSIKPDIILDLACGTGTISFLLARLGYDVIGADISEDMLMRAHEKSSCLKNPPMFIHQSMEQLDLYGGVDAIVCCLDSINYVTNEYMLKKAFKKINIFLQPGGIFIFDINSIYKFKHLDGQNFVRQSDDVFCSWQIDIEDELCYYDFDIFELNKDETYDRYKELHVQRLYDTGYLASLLKRTGFSDIRIYGDLSLDAPKNNEHRIFFTARKGENHER